MALFSIAQVGLNKVASWHDILRLAFSLPVVIPLLLNHRLSSRAATAGWNTGKLLLSALIKQPDDNNNNHNIVTKVIQGLKFRVKCRQLTHKLLSFFPINAFELDYHLQNISSYPRVDTLCLHLQDQSLETACTYLCTNYLQLGP